jgi:nucleotide-binding universal stress UspA family protein
MPSFQRILVATDFGEISNLAIDRALDLARDVGARVTLLHVTPMPPYYYAAYAEGLAWPTEEIEGAARQALDESLAAARKKYDKVDAKLLTGSPRAQILDAVAQQKADLVVLGTHGRRGLVRAILGSVAESVVRTSPVPVLTVSE